MADDESRKKSCLICGDIQVDSSEKRLSSSSPERPGSGQLQGLGHSRRGAEARDLLVTRRGPDDPAEAELPGFGGAAVGVSDVADLAGEANFPEARERLAVGLERTARLRRGDRERDGQVGPGLVHPDAA